jgi:DNA-binding response OmpR family regulator
MSGYTANIIHKTGILETGIELIAKPFSPNVLLRKVRVVLGNI